MPAARMASSASAVKTRPLGCTVMVKAAWLAGETVIFWVSLGTLKSSTLNFAFKPIPPGGLALPFSQTAGAGAGLWRRRCAHGQGPRRAGPLAGADIFCRAYPRAAGHGGHPLAGQSGQAPDSAPLGWVGSAGVVPGTATLRGVGGLPRSGTGPRIAPPYRARERGVWVHQRSVWRLPGGMGA